MNQIEARRLCANPVIVLEIEDGTITNTSVVRAADLIAALDDSVRQR
ncbi:hypothetical protein [Mycobacteroides chelonae]|nr:hypothetical protein [Mycobacteroides chelonae]